MESIKQISNLVERRILLITEPRIVDKIRQLLVVPYPVERLWDFWNTLSRTLASHFAPKASGLRIRGVLYSFGATHEYW